jgi:hypothetical protein
MSFTETLKNLLIPRKTQTPVAQPNYGTDMRAIENWVSGDLMGFLNDLVSYVNDITPGTGYASLTGTGETSPTGELTQGGDLTVTGNLSVNGSTGVAVANDLTVDGTTNVRVLNIGGDVTGFVSGTLDLSFGDAFISLTDGISAELGYSVSSSNFARILLRPSLNGIDITTGTSQPIGIGAGGNLNLGSGGVTSLTGTTAIQIQPDGSLAGSGALGFFGATPHALILGSSITTLAQLVTALQDYGILG